MEAPLLKFTRMEFEAFRLGMAQKRPVHLLTCFDGENLMQIERHYPVLQAVSTWVTTQGPDSFGPTCKHCKHPESRWYMMDEKLYGPKAYLCGNCEQLSYLKG